MDRVSEFRVDGTKLIHRFADHIHYPAKGFSSHRHGDGTSRIDHLHSTDQPFRRQHRYTADSSFPQVLLHFHYDAEAG